MTMFYDDVRMSSADLAYDLYLINLDIALLLLHAIVSCAGKLHAVLRNWNL